MKAWQCGRSQWVRHSGVHEPHIAEISPMQMGLMSKRQRAAYNKRRAAEWAASSDSKVEWARLVIAAYEDFAFDLDDPDLSEDARREVETYQRRYAEKVAKQHAADALAEQLETVPFADIRVGDVLRTPYGRAKVLKKNRVTLKCAQQFGAEFVFLLRGTEFVREKAQDSSVTVDG